jgi:hypothetical protein
MSLRELLTTTDLMFLIAGAYFVILAVLQEASIFTIVPALFCFVAFALGLRKGSIFTGPWRVATSVFALVLFVSQVYANAQNFDLADYISVISFLLNSILFILFLGVFLLCLRELSAKKEAEEEAGSEKQTQTTKT